MKIISLALLALFSINAHAIDLAICHGEFALCAASPAVPTGQKIVVNATVYQEGMAVCPVLKGESIADLHLMNGSCKAPKGKVWSTFSTLKSFPQAPSWDVVTMVPRTFVTTDVVGGGMSNMWSFLCTKQKKKVNGVKLAKCYGPLNESPWGSTPIPAGTKVVTGAPLGASDPVGGNIP